MESLSGADRALLAQLSPAFTNLRDDHRIELSLSEVGRLLEAARNEVLAALTQHKG